MSSRLKKRVLNEQQRQQQKQSLNMAQKLRTLCREVTDVNPKWRRKAPKPEHKQTTFSPREMRHKRKEDGDATSWTCTMHVMCLTSLTLVAIILALGILGAQQQKEGDLNSDEVLESTVCSKKEVEDGQCHPDVPKDSHLDELNVVSKQQESGKHINDNYADNIANTASCAEQNIGKHPESDSFCRKPLTDIKSTDSKSTDTKCSDKSADTKCASTKCTDTKGRPIDSNPSSNTKVTDSNTKPVSSTDSNTTMSVDLYKAFDWVPGRSAKIDDPVDDSNFPYHRLNTFRPRSVLVDGLDVVSVELKRVASAKGSQVRAYLLDDLLSAEECDTLRHVHDDHVTALSADPIICFDSVDTLRHHLRHIGKHDVTVSRNDFTKDTRCVNSTLSASLRTWGLRWSTGTGFYPGESAFSRVLERRIQKVTGLTAVNGGAYRVVSYLQNVGYKEHTDCSVQRMKGTEDRYATVLIYLDDVQVGGHTYFPELGISIKPKKGRALVWNNMSKEGRCDPTSLHAALPVIKGTKYILQRWYYYDNFPGVSSRPPVPPIPARLPTQGLVSCDEYRHGSCRLYDIWTYDVVTRW